MKNVINIKLDPPGLITLDARIMGYQKAVSVLSHLQLFRPTRNIKRQDRARTLDTCGAEEQFQAVSLRGIAFRRTQHSIAYDQGAPLEIQSGGSRQPAHTISRERIQRPKCCDQN